MSDSALLGRIRRDLARVRDPQRAEGMARYLKSAMPCLGVPVPEARRIALAAVREESLTDPDRLIAEARRLWSSAGYREERYAAIALFTAPPSVRPEALGPLHAMAVEGAWWDLVDSIAKPVGMILREHREPATPLISAWAQDPDRWARRLAIIAQLGHRERTDRTLLADVIDANVDDPDFFIRKAIGWALRDYAKHDPAWVRDVVDSRRLSPLSRREALKHVG